MNRMMTHNKPTNGSVINLIFHFPGLHPKPSRQAAGDAPEAVLHPDGQRVEAVHQMLPRLDPLQARPEVIPAAS